jgi:methyltransferase (TIGR00027 family)
VRNGQASWTARRVAARRLGFARVPADYGRPDDDQRLQADVADGVHTADDGERMARYLRARTGFVDRSVVRVLDAGTPQALLVGAGYDGRALRYARPGVAWFELDHPDTQADKRERLARLGIADDHIRYVPAEIGVADVPAALAAAGHDAARPTLVVCEGLVPYLPAEVCTGLLAELAGRAAPRSTLVLELPLVPRTAAGRMRRESLRRTVSGWGEPIRSAFPVEELTATLEGCGWTVHRADSPRGGPIEDNLSNVAFVVAAVTPPMPA